MSDTRCPSCDAVLPAKELEDGWCDACGKKVPPFVLRGASSAPRDGSRNHPGTLTPEKGKMKKGQLLGTFLGIVLFAVLMAGPLRSTGYLITLGAGFVIIFLAGAVGGRFDRSPV